MFTRGLRKLFSTKQLIITGCANKNSTILSDLNDLVLSKQGKLLDSQFMKFWGNSTIMALVSIPESQLEGFKQAVELTNESSGYDFSTMDAIQSTVQSAVPESYGLLLKVQGVDTAGITYRITQELSVLRIAIRSLNTETVAVPMGGMTLFRMDFELSAPNTLAFEEVEEQLLQLEEELDMYFDLVKTSGESPENSERTLNANFIHN